MGQASGNATEAGDAAFSARTVVDWMAGLVRGDAWTRDAGQLATAQEVQAALMAQLEGNVGHVVLWEQFLRTPEAVSDALTSVVAAEMRRDDVLAAWLHGAWARRHEAG